MLSAPQARHFSGGRSPPALTRERRFFGLGLGLLRRVPLVAALQAFPVIAARLRGFHLGTDEPAVRALLVDRLVPRHEVARLVRAGVERGPTLAGAALHE